MIYQIYHLETQSFFADVDFCTGFFVLCALKAFCSLNTGNLFNAGYVFWECSVVHSYHLLLSETGYIHPQRLNLVRQLAL